MRIMSGGAMAGVPLRRPLFCTAMCAAQAIALQVAAHSFLSLLPRTCSLASEVCPDNDLPSDTRSEFERYAIAAVC